MNWNDAMSACQNLGSGWRLPTEMELKAMNEQLQNQGKGNFQNAWYWSSSKGDWGGAGSVDFASGDVKYKDKSKYFQVRAVREYRESLNPSMNEELNRAAENYGSRP